MSRKKALIVDDEPDICELAEITLSRMGIDTRSAGDIETAKSLLSTESFDLCLTDMNLPDGDGIDLVEYIQTHYSNIPVAVITAYGNMQLAVRALKAGAFDFVSKPVNLDVLRNLVNSAMNLPKTQAQNLKKTPEEEKLLGDSSPIKTLRKKIAKLARSQAPVFIYGESGCGKELVANLIHEQGSRANYPFIPVNCGAIPNELMESEFFGHRKGSFTGASSDKDGLFKAADGGTLFLDEVADLPQHMQVKLLRAIQEKSIRSVGDHTEQSVDVRILSASHKNLAELVRQNKFREDLYYRINVIELNVPALREHSEDIPLLADYLLEKLAFNSHKTKSPAFSTQAMNSLKEHSFPGNVRELENILERAIALAEDNIIQVEDLQLPKTSKESGTTNTNNQQNNIHDQLNLIEHEKDNIVKALEKTRWNKTAAAKLLGLTLRQLRYRLEKLDIN